METASIKHPVRLCILSMRTDMEVGMHPAAVGWQSPASYTPAMRASSGAEEFVGSGSLHGLRDAGVARQPLHLRRQIGHGLPRRRAARPRLRAARLWLRAAAERAAAARRRPRSRPASVSAAAAAAVGQRPRRLPAAWGCAGRRRPLGVCRGPLQGLNAARRPAPAPGLSLEGHGSPVLMEGRSY